VLELEQHEPEPAQLVRPKEVVQLVQVRELVKPALVLLVVALSTVEAAERVQEEPVLPRVLEPAQPELALLRALEPVQLEQVQQELVSLQVLVPEPVQWVLLVPPALASEPVQVFQPPLFLHAEELPPLD
jgi:hypothetical protein